MSRQAERRLYPRAPMQGFAARLSVAGGASHDVSLVDLSLGGVSWVGDSSREPLQGADISLVIGSRGGLAPRLRLDAVVVRHDRAAGGAAQILRAEDRQQLERYVRPAALHRPDGRSSRLFDRIAALGLLAANLASTSAGRRRIILVTSPRVADGKSFVAAGIAAGLARLGERVLLIDADLHHPTQHLLFRVKGAPGLAQLLSEARPPYAQFVQAGHNGVEVLAAGSATPASALFTGGVARLSEAILSLAYPFVVIDAPPVLLSTGACQLAPITTDLLLTVRSASTRERDVEQALGLLQRNGSPATGVVLNDYSDTLPWRDSNPYAPKYRVEQHEPAKLDDAIADRPVVARERA